MEHFEQGLKGNIKSMIASHTFENFQVMYQKAIKIARVLEESESENQTLSLEKRKKDSYKPGFQGRNFKRYRPNFPQGKEKQPMHWREKPYCRVCGENHDGPC